MKSQVILFLFSISLNVSASNLKPGCFQFRARGELQERCTPQSIDYDHIKKEMEKVVQNKIQYIRLIGNDDDKVLFFSASITQDEPKFCQMQYDRIIKYNVSLDKVEELWRSDKNIKNIFENVDHVRLLYLLNSKDNPQNLHKCAPIVNLVKSKKVNKNKGSNYNSLLKEENQLVVNTVGKPGIFIFGPKFEKILGSLLIPEEFYSIVDAEISSEGSLVTIIRDEVRHVTCLSEYDIESNTTLFKKCASKDHNYSFLYKEDEEIFVMHKHGLKPELLKPLSSIKSNIKEIKH